MPAHTTDSAGSQRLEGLWDELARRGEDDGGVELIGWQLVAAAGPRRAEAACELLGALIARAREGVHVATLVDGDLADHVSRRAESVQPEPRGVAGELQRPVADQPAAQQRRRLLIGELGGQLEAEPFVGDGELGVATVDVAAGEARVHAQVLARAERSNGSLRPSTRATARPRADRPR